MRLIYFIGAPGAGRTTLLAELTKHLTPWPERNPLAWTGLYAPESTRPVAVEIGHRPRGVDALPPNAQPFVVAWLKSKRLPALCDGDRLANDAFFQSVKDAGYQLTVIHVDTPAHIAEWRAPDVVPGYARERRRIVEKLAERWNAWRVDGTLATHDAARRVARLHPVLKEIYRAAEESVSTSS